jgi:hypothetical protein
MMMMMMMMMMMIPILGGKEHALLAKTLGVMFVGMVPSGFSSTLSLKFRLWG